MILRILKLFPKFILQVTNAITAAKLTLHTLTHNIQFLVLATFRKMAKLDTTRELLANDALRNNSNEPMLAQEDTIVTFVIFSSTH